MRWHRSTRYFWRARAEDECLLGPCLHYRVQCLHSGLVQARVLSPINNVTVDSLRPRFSFANAQRNGPSTVVSYLVELADSDSLPTRCR